MCSALALCCCCAAFAAAREPQLQAVVDDAWRECRTDTGGELAQYIPALAAADPNDFAVVIATVDGRVFAAGDAGKPFAIMSAAKPFTLALLLQQRGPQFVMDRIGVEPTGLPFDALSTVDRSPPGPLNPMVNAGAITAVSLLQADSPAQRWQELLDWYGAFAGEPLALLEPVYRSVSSGGLHNRAILDLLELHGMLGAPQDETLDVYNRQSSVAVTARQLAVMGATLANGGVNPVSGKRVLDADNVDEVLSMMLMAGFYDEAGRWAYTAGLPAKSGVGGGVVAVAPGRMAIVGYSPRLSGAGNSVRAMAAVAYISRQLQLGLFDARAVR